MKLPSLLLVSAFLTGLSSASSSDERAIDIDHQQLPSLPPSWQHNWTIDQIEDHLECEDILDEVGWQIPTKETWSMLREAYRNLVGAEMSSILPTDEKTDFLVPYKVDFIPGKGRGVIATAPILKGTLIWTSHERYSARFPNGAMYRKFLSVIPTVWACEIFEWSYVEEVGGSNLSQLTITTDLNDGAFMNTKWNIGDPDENTGYDQELSKNYPGDWKKNIFALQDIEAGEELMVHYGDFADPKGWALFGIQKST